MSYRLNPTWCAAARLTTPDGADLRVLDQSLLLRVVGAAATKMPTAQELEAFEKDLALSGTHNRCTKRLDVEMSLSDLRRDVGYRTVSDVADAFGRLSVVVNGGHRLFERVDVKDGVATVVPFGSRQGVYGAHPFFARRLTKVPLRHGGDAPYVDRAFTLVDPLLVAGFGCTASLHAYLRLRTWLTTPCRDGLPHAGQWGFDTSKELRIRAPARAIADMLGVKVARPSRSYVTTAIERVLAELRGVDIVARFLPPRERDARLNAVLDVRLGATPTSTWEEERDQGAVPFEGRTLRMRGGVKPAPKVDAAPVVADDVVEAVAPEPVVKVAPSVPVPPGVPAAPNEVEDDDLDLVPDAAEPWEYDATAADGPVPDDGFPSHVEPGSDPVPVVPPEPVTAAPEPAPTPEVDPDNDPTKDYLEPGEIRPGVWRDPSMAKVTRIGEPKSERQLGIESPGRAGGSGRQKLVPGHRGCPPEETPHRHQQYPGVWTDQRCPEGHAPIYPIRAWYRDGPDDLYDTGEYEDENIGSDVFYVCVTPQARTLHSFLEVMAYVDECKSFYERDHDLQYVDHQFDPTD